jgi:hypothetical protein
MKIRSAAVDGPAVDAGRGGAGGSALPRPQNDRRRRGSWSSNAAWRWSRVVLAPATRDVLSIGSVSK